MSYKEDIVGYCNKLGIENIGFTKCRVFEELREFYSHRKSKQIENEFEEDDIEKRINPFLYMEEGKTIISLAFPYIYEKYNNTEGYFSKYTLGIDYHKVVGKYMESICGFIESLGGKAKYFVDSNALPERYIAYLSGVGFIGKNNMLITEEYGSYIFLGEIVTDLEIEEDRPKETECGECDICLRACPVSAIDKENNNPNMCLSYITQKKDIDEQEMSELKGRLFGCDTCQDVCPYNKNIKFSQLEEFKPFDFMKTIDYEDILNMSKKDFNEKYKLTSCGWRGKSILQRNVLINLARLKKLDEGKKFNSPYIQEYYKKLLKK
ncbi:tRNA epoxyqueuosine(34) reductase QueG [Clostridium bovifaecis]|uniref:tRNA epoxyqueuosine(34) reductase QueG n=1 Tax=Clostridium bovifaecis TaxID=2184719 RepID=A0A6I6F6E8_9CLOT|nr:tRNA epoxyqueuosine(34) reductase QueG [Clostridium bovifaecis]